MAFQLARRTRIVVLMVPTWPEPGFREGVARLRGRGLAWRARTATGATGRVGPTRARAGYWAAGDGNSGLTESRREKTE